MEEPTIVRALLSVGDEPAEADWTLKVYRNETLMSLCNKVIDEVSVKELYGLFADADIVVVLKQLDQNIS